MTPNLQPAPRVAIACGGTGGHLFPGLAVGEQLKKRGCAVTLLVSPKDIDQQAVKSVTGMQVATLPGVGLNGRNQLVFAGGLINSFFAARKLFKAGMPEAVLAMGGFTAAPPVLAGRMSEVPAFLHESNTIPGRANRWLARFVSQAFVGFPEAAGRLRTRNVKVTGTPVRAEFQPLYAPSCRAELGLDPERPVLLVTGGSQGASALNDLVIAALPLLARLSPGLQLFHLTGPKDAEKVEKACAAAGVRAVVQPFCAQMHLALGAASAALCRAGASSLAELAALRVPAILIPYPAATDDHQQHNALAFQRTGAAQLLKQSEAVPVVLAPRIIELIENADLREKMSGALAAWHAPQAAEKIADSIMQTITNGRRAQAGKKASPAQEVRLQQTAKP